MFRFRLLVILLLVSLNGSLSNSVQISHTALGDSSASLARAVLLLAVALLQDTELLEGLDDLAVDGTGGVDVVGWAGSAVLGGAVDAAEAAYADGLAHVDVAGYGGGADVEPILGLWWEFVGVGGLDCVDPAWKVC